MQLKVTYRPPLQHLSAFLIEGRLVQTDPQATWRSVKRNNMAKQISLHTSGISGNIEKTEMQKKRTLNTQTSSHGYFGTGDEAICQRHKNLDIDA